MATLRIPTPLRTYTSGQSEIVVNGSTVSEVMGDLVLQYPDLEAQIFNGNGSLRPFVNLFLGEENIQDLGGLETPIQDQDRLLLVPSIAGGRPPNDLSA